MPRARSIKPEFFRDAELVECEPWVRLLFAGLWTVADRRGRLLDRPKQIKIDVFPADDFDVEAGLAELARRRLVVRYEVGGVRYLHVRNFEKHQSPHKNEPDSTLPAPEEHGASTLPAPEEHASNRADSGLLTADSGLRTPDCSGGGGRAPGPVPASPGADAPPSSAPYRLFQALCEETGADESQASARLKAQQCAIGKRILEDGHDEAGVRGCLRYLRSQHWRTSPIDLKTVEAEIGKWSLAGRPAVERLPTGNARASPPAHPTAAERKAAMSDGVQRRAAEVIARLSGVPPPADGPPDAIETDYRVKEPR